MPILIDRLLEANRRRTEAGSMRSFQEPRAREHQTAFLCHSRTDQRLALGLQQLLKEHGWNLYIDWHDIEMPERPSATTVQKIREQIVKADGFLFFATANSGKSRRRVLSQDGVIHAPRDLRSKIFAINRRIETARSLAR